MGVESSIRSLDPLRQGEIFFDKGLDIPKIMYILMELFTKLFDNLGPLDARCGTIIWSVNC